MSAPSSPVAHSQLSVPQDELSSQFFNFNHQQCLLNELKNYWHKTIFPQGSLTKALVTFLPRQERATTTHTFIFKPWTISDCQPQFFIIPASHRNLKIQGGTSLGIERNKFARKLVYLQEGKCLLNDFFVVVKSPARIHNNCQSLRKCYNPVDNTTLSLKILIIS